VQFFDRKRRKSGWLTGIGRANEEEVLWEEWLVEVTIARPKTEGGENLDLILCLRVISLTAGSPQSERRYDEQWKAHCRRQR
jgi:hypothetical protein